MPATDRWKTIETRAYPLSDPFDPAREHARGLLRALGYDCIPPRRERPRSAAVEWAGSGAMALTGSPDGPPEFACGALASAASGAMMALAAIAPGRGFETIDAPALLGERAAIGGLSRRGEVSPGGSARLLATRRDSLVLNLPRGEDWQLIPALLETECNDLVSTRDWQTLAQRISNREPGELLDRGRLMGLAIASVAPERTDDRSIFVGQLLTENLAADRPSRPIRLLDLSSLWAGPLATSLLAMAGIDVLKVESPTRPDGARQGPGAFFDLLNGGKRGCALDLHEAQDRSVFERLLDTADIVLESARPRALAQLGIDAADWVDRRPGRIWASITGYGRAREWIAFGDDAAVAAGLARPVDGSPSNLRFCGDAIADPLTGLHAAVFILAHLEKGRGGLLDLSLVDIARLSASIENEQLVLPIERASDGWCVVEQDRPFSIRKPRARRGRFVAAQLRSPSEDSIGDWTRPC